MKLLLIITIICYRYFVFGAKNGRIIGGNSAYIYQYSFAAAINVQTATSRYFCGGALYQQQWVITAGQCVDGAVLFTIQLGSAHLDGDDSNRITVASSEYYLHPDYNPQTLEADIGMIKLRMPVEYTDYIRAVAPLAMHHLPAKDGLRAIGWGQTSDSNSSLSDELRVATVASLSTEECRMVYGNQITDNMVCVVGNYNEGACHGDTGSPLLDAYSKYTNVHVGVASFVSGRGCETTDPSGYTRTYSYEKWLLNLTGAIKQNEADNMHGTNYWNHTTIQKYRETKKNSPMPLNGIPALVTHHWKAFEKKAFHRYYKKNNSRIIKK